jgi:hypothetical protein
MSMEINHDEVMAKFETYSREMLNRIICDAQAAIEARLEGPEEGYYSDRIHYAVAELRKRGGLPIISEARESAQRMMLLDKAIFSVWTEFYSTGAKRRMFAQFGRSGMVVGVPCVALIKVQDDEPGEE